MQFMQGDRVLYSFSYAIEEKRYVYFKEGDIVDAFDERTKRLLDQPKGLKQVLLERGLWEEGMLRCCSTGKKGSDEAPDAQLHREDGSCCAVGKMAAQQDFREQRCWLEEVITEANHLGHSHSQVSSRAQLHRACVGAHEEMGSMAQ